MAYKDMERQREYQRRWVSAKRQQEHNEMISTATAETTQQTGLDKPFIAQLEDQLAAAEAEAAPILESISKYEREIIALEHELHDWIDRNDGGVMRSMPVLTPEERVTKERELLEKKELVKKYNEMLGPVTYNSIESFNRGRGHTTAKIEKLRGQIKAAEESAGKHRQRIAQLESDEQVARVQAKAEEKRREAAKLTEEADRIESNRLAAIKAETAHLQQLTGEDGG